MAGNLFKQWMKNYLNFSKKDRKAVVTLGILICFVLIGHLVVNRIEVNSNLDREEAQQAIAEWRIAKENNTPQLSLFNFDPNTVSSEKLDSLAMPAFVKQNIVSYREAGGKFVNPDDIRKIYGMNDSIFAEIRDYVVIQQEEFVAQNAPPTDLPQQRLVGYFDPNKADMDTLLKFGFNNFQASNLVKYRASGGSFENPEEILKIYGVDTPFFESIQKHIVIQDFEPNQNQYSSADNVSIELNTATQEELETLRGIGPVFAERIVKFRNLLGGFCSKNQLLEVYNLPEETYYNIEGSITVDTALVKQIRLNFADYSELLRHPYIDQDEVENIINYRQENGPFASTEQLLNAGLVSAENFEKVKPYLNCR